MIQVKFNFFRFIQALLLFFAVITQKQGFSQQTIRGEIVETVTKKLITDVTVYVSGDKISKSILSDSSGYFRLSSIYPGNYKIFLSHIGYFEKEIQIVVFAGKETVLQIEMEEKLSLLGEVIIKSGKKKYLLNNESVISSGRTYNIEESRRFAGSFGDPARIATNFAGTTANNDSRNDIIIRGNSPLGISWRLNEVDIPNPNHFGSFGSTGGAVSILNHNTLSKSDFLTGAFPAEYGNVLAGVFDLSMRPGNNEKQEHLAQIGINGFELGSEGPVSIKHKSSYLINYRYSSLAVLNKLGLNFGTGGAIPEYQDISFNVNFPQQKFGKINLFGIAGKSAINIDAVENERQQGAYGDRGFDINFKTKAAVLGATTTIKKTNNSSIKIVLGISYTGTKSIQDSVSKMNNEKTLWYTGDFDQVKLNAGFKYLKKINTFQTLLQGFSIENNLFSLNDKKLYDGTELRPIRNSKGLTALARGFVQWQLKRVKDFSISTGIHSQFFFLTNSLAIEPRANIKWSIRKNHSLYFGAGLHSQTQPVYIYFNQTKLINNEFGLTNRNLGFTKSLHLISGYQYSHNGNTYFKADIYYQHVYDIPVEKRESYFSLINIGSDFSLPLVDSLKKSGTGNNYGIELTFEKLLSKNYYLLSTLSIYESNYKGSDKIKRNTAFNSNYSFNLLGGYTYKINKATNFTADLRIRYAGGRRYIPIDLNSSIATGEEILLTDNAYSPQFDPYFRADIKIGMVINRKKITHEWAIDFQNITNRENIFFQSFDKMTGTIKNTNQLGLLILPTYRLLF